MVKIDPFDLPESNSKTVAPTNLIVQIEKNGTVKLNGKKTSLGRLYNSVRKEALKLKVDRKDMNMTIVAEKGVSFKKVQKAIEVAAKMRINAMLATAAK